MSAIRIGLIGGSGLGVALGTQTGGTAHDIETPLGPTSGPITETNWAGLTVFFLSRHGPGHTLNPTAVPFRANIFALKSLGVTHILASGAVGSLREEFKPRQLVIPDQVIDKTHKRSNTFFERAAVHAEFAEPFCPVLRRTILEAAKLMSPTPEVAPVGGPEATTPPASPTVHDGGCYVCMEGPAFSTRAESLMHRLWGGDLVGMTAMPEAKLAREAEIAYALVALVTDYDCWRQKPAASDQPGGLEADPFVLLKEIIANMEHATKDAIDLIRRTVELMATRTADQLASPAHQALKLGIWSDKSRIPKDEVDRLAPLWGKYF